MRKDTNKDLDLLFKEGLEDAAVKAPRGVWEAVSARLDAAAPAAAAAPKRSWLLWGAPAFAFAAAALAVVLVVGRTDKTIISSGEEIVAVADAQPSGPVAVADETTDQVGGDALVAANVLPVTSNANRSSNIGVRADYVPKEVQNPDQITVIPSVIPDTDVIPESNPSVIPDTDRESDDVVSNDPSVISSEVEKSFWADVEAEPAKRSGGRVALQAGGITGGNDAHIQISRPAFSSGLPSEGIQENTPSYYHVPVSVGLGVRYYFTDKLAAGAGVNWSFLTREFSGKYKTEEGTFTHNLQYVGIPVSVSYDVVNSKTLLFYCYAGGSVEKAISSKYYIYSVNSSPLLSEDVPSLQYGLLGGIGVEFRLSDRIGLYADPGVKYYFPGNQPKSVRTDRPLMFSLEAGLRFNLK